MQTPPGERHEPKRGGSHGDLLCHRHKEVQTATRLEHVGKQHRVQASLQKVPQDSRETGTAPQLASQIS